MWNILHLLFVCIFSLKVHLCGASLGGFLAQKFAECTYKSPRVHSLILCNSFSDTSIFNQTWAANRSFNLHVSFDSTVLSPLLCQTFIKQCLAPQLLVDASLYAEEDCFGELCQRTR